ncbi:MAG: serine hydrolase domain-containing protein [Candidatus Thorarchaeota archaeon]
MTGKRIFAGWLLIPLLLFATALANSTICASAQMTRDYWPTDDWRTSTPAEQGVNSSRLEEAAQYIVDSGARVRSMLIVHNGYLIFERYFTPSLYDVDDTHIIYSCTKSVTSNLIGIAIDKGYIDNTSQLLVDFFPDIYIDNLDSRKESITLENVLTMTSGLQWDEERYDEPNDYFGMTGSENWVQYVLNKTMVADPGTTFYYNTGGSHLLSAIINRTTGMSTLAFAIENLFEPLGITTHPWPVDPQGIHFGGSALALRPRDMAKFGYLYLNNGIWDGDQIVSSDWVATSRYEHVPIYGGTFSYGYQWWINSPSGYYCARGYQGQFIFVVPEEDLVVVFSSDMDDIYISTDYLVTDYIVPAVQDDIVPHGSDLLSAVLVSVGIVGSAVFLVLVAYTLKRRAHP